MSVIKPTVGRKVWFWPGPALAATLVQIPEQPCDATILAVWNDRIVNLEVVGHNGSRQFVGIAPLVQPGELAEATDNRGYAEWMPYQQGQAAKTEAAEKVAAAAEQACQRPVHGGYPNVASQAPGAMCGSCAVGGCGSNCREETDIGDVISQTIAAKLRELGIDAVVEHVRIDAGTNEPEPPRLTVADIERAVVGETYTILPSGLTTVCELTLRNGYRVTGVNHGPVSAVAFNEAIGREEARKVAIEQVWQLEGYLLRQQLHESDFEALFAEAAADRRAQQAVGGTA